VDLGEELRELPDEMIALDSETGTLEQIEWGSDGQAGPPALRPLVPHRALRTHAPTVPARRGRC